MAYCMCDDTARKINELLRSKLHSKTNNIKLGRVYWVPNMSIYVSPFSTVNGDGYEDRITDCTDWIVELHTSIDYSFHVCMRPHGQREDTYGSIGHFHI
jgi:hypothetical protein